MLRWPGEESQRKDSCVKYWAFLTSVIVMAALPTIVSAPRADAAIRLPVGVVSVSTMYPSYTDGDYADEARKVRDTGASAIRIPAKWNLIQPGSPLAYDWARLDVAVNAARGNGLMVLMNLEGPAPVWAQAPGSDPLANGSGPADASTFRTFATAVANRYSSKVTAWEIWNEPNLSHYLIPPTADAYLPLLKAAYTGIRSTGSKQPVVTGGLSSSRAETRDTEFISRLYALGGRSYFDGIGVHPYTHPYAIAADPRYGDGGGASVLLAARATMLLNGDIGKQLWITEYGFPTGKTADSVSEATQSTQLIDAINRANLLGFVAAFFVFNSQDLTEDKMIGDGNFGLYRYDGTAKPAVGGLQTLLR